MAEFDVPKRICMKIDHGLIVMLTIPLYYH